MEVFELFEGTCPVCHAEVCITHVGGTEKFLQAFATDYKEAERQVWEPGTWGSTDGELTFKCANGHEIAVGHNRYGDWML